MLRRLGLLLITLWLGACTPTIEGLVHEQGFTLATLQQGGLTVGGVSSAEHRADTHPHLYGNLLHAALQERLPAVAVQAENEFQRALNGEQQHLVLDEFSRRAQLSAANMNALKAALGTRYVVLARIEENELSHERRDDPATVDSSGKTIRPAATTSTSTRRLYVSLYLFDLHSGHRVWGGSLQRSASNNKSYSHDNSAVNLIRGVAALANGMDSAYPYPPTPEEEPLLTELFSGFARNLAKLK